MAQRPRNPSRISGALGSGGRYGYRRDAKRERAEARQVERDKLTAEQQIAKLDSMFGPGQGAKQERARLCR